MASTSNAESSSLLAMEEAPNWLEMPDELMLNIFQRLRTVQLLKRAREVCTKWQRICNDPAVWKVINVDNTVDAWVGYYDLENLTKEAVDLSRGEAIDISIEGFGTDHLLNHIVQRSSKLKRLCLGHCYNITGRGLSQAVKRLPELEELRVCSPPINAEDIEVIGRNCPRLKSFKLEKEFTVEFISGDDNALAIAKNMPELRHLVMFDREMTNNGLKAILDGCPHLQSVDVRTCDNLSLRGDLGKLCVERVKDFKFPVRVEDLYYVDDTPLSSADLEYMLTALSEDLLLDDLDFNLF